MSEAQPPTGDEPEDDDEDWVEANRQQLEREADSDARDAWVYQRILEHHDGGEE